MIDVTGSPTSYKVKAANQKFSLATNESENYKLTLKLFGFIPISPEELNRPNFYARDVDGTKLIIAEDKSDRQVVATEAQQQDVNNAWHDRIGDYSIVNPIDTDNEMFNIKSISLGYEDRLYYTDVENAEGITRTLLTVINDTEAISQGVGRSHGETIFANPDGSLMSSGLRLSRIK